LCAEYSYANPDDYPDADRDPNANEHADPNQHPWGNRLLSVCRLLRRSNRRHVWWVCRGVWCVLRRRLAVPRFNSDCHGNPNNDGDGNEDTDNTEADEHARPVSRAG
jgi:hypothetical protein